MMQLRSVLLILSLVLAISAHPTLDRRASFSLKNGRDAIALKYVPNTCRLNPADSSCQSGENACVDKKFAQCVNGKFVLQACGPGTICSALPLINSPGTAITCTTEADAAARIAATGAQSAGGNTGPNSWSGGNNAGAGGAAGNDNDTDNNGGANNAGGGGAAGNDGNNDPQKSLTLDPAVIAKGFANDGQDVPVDGQVASLTSTNNFINFCKEVDLPITNGQQKTGGSCNPAPMGAIPSASAMPSSKFVFPKNGGNVVVEKLDSLTQTTPTDPNTFAFFKGVNGKADAQGVLTVDVEKGLPAGTYKLSSINAAANHQPVLVAIAQHGSLDDVVYFTVQ